jgi:transcriptional regulator with XRE-family HTH domain
MVQARIESMAKKFGEKLKNLRLHHNMTLEELAGVIGTSKAYMWQMENKTHARPSAELLLKIANHFDQAPEFLLDDQQEEPSQRQDDLTFLRKLRKLSETDRQTIERIIASFGPSHDTGRHEYDMELS